MFVDGKTAEAGFKLVVDAVKFVPTCTDNGEWPSDAIIASNLIAIDPSAFTLFVADDSAEGNGNGANVPAGSTSETRVLGVLYVVAALLIVLTAGVARLWGCESNSWKSERQAFRFER